MVLLASRGQEWRCWERVGEKQVPLVSGPCWVPPPAQHIMPLPTHTFPWQPCGDRQCSLKTHFAVQRTEAQWLCLSSTSKREPLKGLEPENGVFRSRLQRLHQECAEGPWEWGEVAEPGG